MNNDFIITEIARVIFVGKDEYKEPVSSFISDLSYNELIFFLSGKATVKFNGKTLTDTENSVRFLPKGRNFEYTVERESSGECIDVFFSADCPISNEAFVLNPSQSDALCALFKKLFSVWVSKKEGYYFECVSLLYKIFSELQKQSYLPENQYNAIKPAIKYIEEHFLESRLSMEDLTAQCTVSYSYLKKLFVKKTGLSPKKYIIQLKINYACDLLKCNKYTVSKISDMCGFLDIYYFSSQFKRHMGISPTEYIEKCKSSK